MTVGSLVATGLVVAWSQVHTLTALYAVLIGIGVTGAMVLYEPAFAVIISWFDSGPKSQGAPRRHRRRRVRQLIFLPLTGVLVVHVGWRTALLVLAAGNGLITIPLHALVVRKAPPASVPGAMTSAGQAKRRRVAARAATRDGRFWILVVAFVAHGAAMSAMTVHLVAYLTSRGHPAPSPPPSPDSSASSRSPDASSSPAPDGGLAPPPSSRSSSPSRRSPPPVFRRPPPAVSARSRRLWASASGSVWPASPHLPCSPTRRWPGPTLPRSAREQSGITDNWWPRLA